MKDKPSAPRDRNGHQIRDGSIVLAGGDTYGQVEAVHGNVIVYRPYLGQGDAPAMGATSNPAELEVVADAGDATIPGWFAVPSWDTANGPSAVEQVGKLIATALLMRDWLEFVEGDGAGNRRAARGLDDLFAELWR